MINRLKSLKKIDKNCREEVQLPFLQHLFNAEFKIVPICMMLQDEQTSKEVGDAIAEASAGKDVVIIASTDFTHYEPQRLAVEKNHKAIDKILALDAAGLVRIVEEEAITMCGYGAVSAMSQAAKKLGAKKVKLLKYATSGETAEPKAAIDVLRRAGAIDYVAERARELVTQAKSKLRALPESRAREVLLELADFTIKREF